MGESLRTANPVQTTVLFRVKKGFREIADVGENPVCSFDL